MDLFGQPDAATLDILRRVDAKYLPVFEAAESPADRIAVPTEKPIPTDLKKN
jgi:hypothetical protein